MKYFFILGKNPILSSAEIAAVFEQLKLNVSFSKLSDEVLLFETTKKIKANNLMSRLGGTVKIGVVVQIGEKVETNISNIILKNVPTGKKIYFGFSLYKLDKDISNQELQKLNQKIKDLGIKIKKELKEKGYSSRWVVGKERALSSVIVQKNKLLTQGAEIVILATKNKLLLIGKTLAVQEFEEYSFRDYGRPKRDMKIGLLPPKLAKIMINLAKIDQEKIILDPFCGFGTILGEAALLGYQNLIGSDIDAKVLEGAKENLKWLEKNFQFSISNLQLLKSDVRDLATKLQPHSIDAIITEPYLGPPLRGNETKEKLEKIMVEIKKLYLASFNVFKQILKRDGKIVIIFPVYIYNGQKIFLEILPELEKLGFKVISLLPEIFLKHFTLNVRGSALYFRPDQRLGREVFIFEYRA